MKKLIFIAILTPIESTICMGNLFTMTKDLSEAGVAAKSIATHIKSVVEKSTSLHAAIKEGQVEGLELLPAVQDQLNVQDSNGHTPLHLAANRGNMDQINWLLGRGAKVNLPDRQGHISLHLAIIKGHADASKKLIEVTRKAQALDHPNLEGKTALVLAVLHDQFDSFKILLRNGAGVDLPDNDGNTLLHVIVKKGAWKYFEEIVPQLPKLINIKNAAGETAFHIAAAGQNADIFKHLIEKADIEETTNGLWTPLFFAVAHNRFEYVKLLLRKGAQWDRLDAQKRSSVCIAAQNSEASEILLHLLDNRCISQNPEATPVLRALQARNVKALEEMLKRSIDRDRRYADGKSIGHHAIEMHYIEAIKLLKELGIAFDSKDDLERVALVYAVKTGDEGIIGLLCNRTQIPTRDKTGFDALYYAVKQGKLAIVHQLASQYPQLNAWNMNGASLVHVAALFGHSHLIDFLLSKGILINKTDNNSETALHFAVTGMNGSEKPEKYRAVIQMLLRKNADRGAKNSKGLTPQNLAEGLKLDSDLFN